MATLTHEQASEIGRKSGIARRARAKRLEELTELAVERTINPVVERVVNHETPHASQHSATIARLEHQMSLLDDKLDAAVEASDWRDLTNARARLFEQWAQLIGLPKPGSRRPGREPSRRQHVTLSPIEPSPGPAQPPACGQDTPTGSG